MRNGTKVDIKFMETVGAVVKLGQQVSDIISYIQKNVPKVGWYFEWENQFLQGTFIVEWGWKEYKDHRAYYYVGINLDIKLIEMKMEMGVGVSGFAFKLQIFGSLSGAITLSIKTCRYSPDGEIEFGFPFGAEIIGSLGARAQVGCFVKMEGTLETGLKLEDGAFKFRQHEGWSMGCSLKWSGIVGKLTVSGGTAKKEGADENAEPKEDFHNEPKEMEENKSQALENELIGSVDLGKWHWPDSKAEYNPPVIPREDLHKLLKKKLTEGEAVRVKIDEGFFGNKYLNVEDMAKDLEEKIHGRNDIRKDPKSAEGLVLEIRKSLDSIMYGKLRGSTAYIESEQFSSFLEGEEFRHILDKDIDPMQDIINKNE